ncbi:MAG: SCO family protein [Actinomycetota bacterium]
MSSQRRWRRAAAGVVAGACVLAACGGGGGDGDGAAASSAAPVDTTPTIIESVPNDRALAGIVRTPNPAVNATALPSLSGEGDVAFQADPGDLQVVYFGYTNCPDVCPTTMFDLTVALRRMPPELAERVDTVMVTIDPDRDLPILDDYVTSFIPDARAAGTADADTLAAAAEPFGASYEVRTTDDGTIEVDHSGFLYVVDDQGELLLTWPFGIDSGEMAADLVQLFGADST